jgi:hypothetical protein
MDVRGVARRRLAVAAATALPALAIAGCGTTVIDNGKVEKAIQQFVASGGNFKAKSVSCPSDVTPKAGGTFTCKLTLTKSSDGSQHSGTVTVHMTNNSGRVTLGNSDFHVQ